MLLTLVDMLCDILHLLFDLFGVLLVLPDVVLESVDGLARLKNGELPHV